MRSWDNVSYVYDPLITYGYRLVVYKSALLAVYAYNHSVQYGPRRAHVYAQNDLEGVMENLCIRPKYTYIKE